MPNSRVDQYRSCRWILVVQVWLILVIGLIAPVSPAMAQDDGLVVDLPVTLKEGDKYRLEVIKEREIDTPQNRQKSGAKTPVDVEVLARLDDGYLIRWTFGSTEIQNSLVEQNELLAELADITNGLKMDVRLDSFGAVAGLENKDEMMSHYRRVIAAVQEALSSLDLPAEELQKVQQALSGVYATLTHHEQFEFLALEIPVMFYFPSGGSYQLGVQNRYNDLLPNPWGGQPFPTDAYLLLRQVDPAENRAVIEWGQEVDKEQARKILHETMTMLAQSAGQTAPSLAELPPVKMQDLSEYVFDTQTGRPLSLDYSREMDFGLARNRTRYVIRVVD